jgi:ABC-type molybdenum transport system ATPase subunit/photorepair protein PhrA
MGLSALQAVGSGFDGIFSRRPLSEEQKARIISLLEFFQLHLSGASIRDIANRPFAYYTPPQQALLLFLRAIVARPPLVILDEPCQGMDEAIWARCRELLRLEWAQNPSQAVIVVTHYEEEVPWGKGGKVMRLVDGVGEVAER